MPASRPSWLYVTLAFALLACDSEVAAVDPVAATLSQQSSPDGSAEPSVQPLAEAGPASFRPQAGFPDEIAAGLATARREFAETVAQSPQAAAPAGLFSGGEELIDPTRMTDRPFFFPPGAYYGAVVRNTSLETLAQPADEAVVTNLVLSHDVSIEVLPQGDFTATWQTRTLQPAGTLYYGVTMPDQHFAVPRYRRESTVLPSGLTSRTHSATGSIATLARPNYDIAGFAANGSGIVEIRAEQFIVELGSSRLYDRRFAFDIQDDGTYRRVPVVSEGPFLDLSGGPGAFTISFDTDAPVNAFVAVWTTEAGLTTIPSPQTNALHHEVPVQLGADTSFYYAVGLRGSGDISTVERWWPARSHAAESTPFRFAVMSDSRSGVGAGEHAYEGTNMRTLRQFMAAIWSEGASFMVFPGDLADGYVSERVDLELQLRAWKDSSEILGRLIPIFEGMGNHEALAEMLVNGRQLDRTDGNSAEAVFASEFVNPLNGPQPESDDAPPYIENVYSWDWGNSHFVMLNSNYWWTNLYAIPGADVGDTHNREGYVMDRQMEWLRADLDAARQRGARHIFAFTHEPPFPNGGHLGDTMWWNGQVPEVIQRRDELIATLLEYDVLAIITGDEHNYSRTLVDSRINPVWEGSLHAIVSGGCGAPYYARDLSAPWAASVQKFSGQQHFNLIDVDGDRVVLTVIGESGEVIEEVDLTAQAP